MAKVKKVKTNKDDKQIKFEDVIVDEKETRTVSEIPQKESSKPAVKEKNTKTQTTEPLISAENENIEAVSENAAPKTKKKKTTTVPSP